MIKFLKIRDVKSPAREAGNAGFDFFVPNYNDLFDEDCRKAGYPLNKSIESNGEAAFFRLAPHSSVCIPSGIKARISNGEALIAMNKSGVALKRHLDIGACVIDPSYEGEIHIHLTNTSDDFVKIECGDKIVQFVPIDYDEQEASIVDGLQDGKLDEKVEAEFYDGHNSKRGTGGFGSTGTK